MQKNDACKRLFLKWASTKDAGWWDTVSGLGQSALQGIRRAGSGAAETVGGFLSSNPMTRAQTANQLVGSVQRPLHRLLGIGPAAPRRRRHRRIVISDEPTPPPAAPAPAPDVPMEPIPRRPVMAVRK